METDPQQSRSPPRAIGSNWVTLNVGGAKFTTLRSTLCSDKESVLYQMFSGDDWKVDRDSDGNVLIDADAQYFGPILNFLRFNEVVIPPNVSNKGVLAAAQFFNVQGVIDYFNRDKRQVIYSWGSGGSGELGTLEKSDVLTPTRVTIVPYDHRVVEVALGANYSCVLTSSGKVYTFGNGDWGQLGLGNPKNFHEKADDKTPIVTVPTVVPKLEKKRVIGIATGYAYAMALTDEHEVYFWGNNNHGQSGLGLGFFGPAFRKIEEPVIVETLQRKEIIQLGCGSFFVLALSQDGKMYSWGLVDCLGLGSLEKVKSEYAPEDIAESVSKDKRTVLLKPKQVKIASSNRVVRINAGQWHSCAITDNGELFTWGVGFQGRLGHGDKEPCYLPTKVGGALEGHFVVDVACGSFHTVALTKNGTVFCWGDNANGQCGSGTLPEAVTRPYCVASLCVVGGGVAKAISCGRQHTAVVMQGPHPWCRAYCCQLRHDGKPQADHGQVYVFGESKGMGLGSAQKVCTAKLVLGMESHNVHSVVSGLHHTFVTADVIPPVPYS
jgi:alpha-tubulin suppressor-like RCC1 family protein